MASLALPTEGASTGRRDHVAAGGPRPSYEGTDQGATLQAANGTSGWVNRMRAGGPTLMGTGPPQGERFRQCGSGRARRPKSREQAPRPSGQGRRPVGRSLLERSGNTQNIVLRLASLVTDQGSGRRWRHGQGIRQRTAGAHDID